MKSILETGNASYRFTHSSTRPSTTTGKVSMEMPGQRSVEINTIAQGSSLLASA